MPTNKNLLLSCIECGAEFLTEGEQNFYKSKGLTMPKRCKECRDKRKALYEQKQQAREIKDLLSALPYMHADKTQIPLAVFPETSLFVIGNGFDLMHGVPSGYYNFRDSMGRHNELRNALETYIRKEDLWADFEESLAYLDAEAMLSTVNDWMDAFDVKDQYDDDFSAADFHLAAEFAIGPAQTIMRELPKRFRKWVCTLEPSRHGKPLDSLINKRATFITFNYTEFLETIYGVPKENVWYIHGDRRNRKKELILGHASGAELELELNPKIRGRKRPRITNQTSHDLHETAGHHLGYYYDATMKKSSDVIKANQARFAALPKMKTVVVIGHSLSRVDYPYFREVIAHNQDALGMKWYVSWYGAGDLQRIHSFANAMGIRVKQIKLFRV